MEHRGRILLEEESPPACPAPSAPRIELQPMPNVQPSPEPDALRARNPGAPRRRGLLVGALCAGAGLLLLHTVTGLVELTRASPILGLAWSAVFVLTAGAAAGAAWRMWARLRALRQRADRRAEAERLLAHDGVAEGIPFCEKLARETGAETRPEYLRWKSLVSATHNDREVLQLFSGSVLSSADRQALDRIGTHAGDVAVMVAVSYFPAVDMLLVLWRQLKVVEDVTAIYGLSPGYWGQIRLLRKVLRNMALAGAAEVATEVGVEALGAGVAARLSGALAQGVAAGVLTARLGLRTMDACRGIPWTPEERPRLRAITTAMIERAKSHLGGSAST